MKNIPLLALVALVGFAACHNPEATSEAAAEAPAPCAEALIAYAERYPAAEPQDLYKLVFQDLYGPGHLLTDSAACFHYIEQEVNTMPDSTALPPYEYTLCDSHYVRINLMLVRHGVLSVRQLTSAVRRSVASVTPDPRFVMSHSAAFKAAYEPHYRIVSRNIFEQELLPLLEQQP